MKDLNKLNDVARHSVSGYGRQDICYNDPEGDFVFYSDYKSLEQRAEAAERERDELRHSDYLMWHAMACKNGERAQKAEAELARRDAAAGEAVAWQFYDDGSWHNGSNHNNHRENTEKAGYRIRELFPDAPPAVVSDAAAGDPDGYIFCHPSGKNFWSISHPDNAGHSGVKPFYLSAPPAVLPPEKPVNTDLSRTDIMKNIAYNQALNDVKALGAQPQKPVVLPALFNLKMAGDVKTKQYFKGSNDTIKQIAGLLDAANVTHTGGK